MKLGFDILYLLFLPKFSLQVVQTHFVYLTVSFSHDHTPLSVEYPILTTSTDLSKMDSSRSSHDRWSKIRLRIWIKEWWCRMSLIHKPRLEIFSKGRNSSKLWRIATSGDDDHNLRKKIDFIENNIMKNMEHLGPKILANKIFVSSAIFHKCTFDKLSWKLMTFMMREMKKTNTTKYMQKYS